MDENLDVENGANGTTTPPVSQSIESAPNSTQELLEFKKSLALMRKELQGLQGRQDKETNEVQRFMGEVKKRMADGMSLEQAELSITAERKASEKDELLFKIARKVGVLDESPSSTTGNGQPMAFDKASALSQYGLDENDPDVASAFSGVNISSALELENVALKAALKKANKPNPDPSAAPAAISQPSRADNNDALKRAYDAELKELAKVGRPSPALISDLKSKYRRKGLEVW